MFVKSKVDYAAYGPDIRIIKDGVYLVFAIEIDQGVASFFALPAGYEVTEQSMPDPLFYPAEIFDVIEDRISSTWKTETIELPHRNVTYVSFPEWFENTFYIRGHDWDFDDDDYVIMKKYIKEYQKVYADLLARTRRVEL